MNKQDLIDAMADAANISKVSAETALNTLLDNIVSTVADDGKVAIAGFGNFELSHRSERMGRNPQTGETIKIAASKVPKFKAGKKFKDAVN